MIPSTHTLLFSVVFLCELKEALLSAHCAGNVCAFQVLVDFEEANEVCKDSRGQLVPFRSEEETNSALTSVQSTFSGRYWLHSTDRAREEAADGLQSCPAVTVTMGRNVTVLWEPCRNKLDGYLCQYSPDEMCSRLHARGGEHVTYTTSMGIMVIDSETFAPGTIAEVGEVGGEQPDSRHLCLSTWVQAPWSCEVMLGGCGYNCSSASKTCICSAGHILHPNNITCTRHPCADCEHGCKQEGHGYSCTCTEGYKLMPDGRSCVDLDECETENSCTAEGEECVNVRGGYECRCRDGFEVEDGVCVNVTICSFCEHMDCQKFSGVYQCVCREGFRVSAKDPTKCEQHCTERDCPAKCIPNPDLEKRDMHQCFCPDGYVSDIRNGTAICTDINECDTEMCDHKCENSFGGYRCLCNDGFTLQGEYKCVPQEEEDEEDGSGSTISYLTPASTPASLHPVALPSYIKTGSILGITLFMVLCAVLLFFLARNAAKRCSSFDLSFVKHPDIDMFYLQQVTTETYKRLSFDRQFKNDSQRL